MNNLIERIKANEMQYYNINCDIEIAKHQGNEIEVKRLQNIKMSLVEEARILSRLEEEASNRTKGLVYMY